MRVLLSVFLVVATTISYGQAAFKFEKKTQKFEKVKAGKLISFDFFYVNSGNKPLLINEIKVACSCTQFTFPKEPVLPQQEGKIHVTFDTNHKIGWQDWILEIYSNTKKSPYKIRFKGMVDND